MKKRYTWLVGTGLALIIFVIAGMMLYTAHFASAVNQPHTASGAVTATGTPIPSTGLQTFQIGPVTITFTAKEA